MWWQVGRDQIVTERIATARNRNELVASQANLQMLQVRLLPLSAGLVSHKQSILLKPHSHAATFILLQCKNSHRENNGHPFL